MDTDSMAPRQPLRSQDWFHRLKAAQRDLIIRCGGIERVADLTSLSKSQAGRWNNPGDTDLMPISAVLLLERDCGQPFVTAVLADLNGWRVIDPEVNARLKGNLLKCFSDLHQEFSRVTSVGAQGLADGVLTPTEARLWDRAMGHAEESLSEMRKLMAAILAGEKAVPVLGED